MTIELNPTEEKIVSATFNILRKDGMSKATTKKISAEAGVNEVTIFRKFENKKNLINITKEYYADKFIAKLEEIFDFTGDEDVGEYIENNFRKMASMTDSEFAIIKVAIEEQGEVEDATRLLVKITDAILDKFEAFFKLQIKKGAIRDVDARLLGSLCYSMTFQSLFYYRIYNITDDAKIEAYGNVYLDILFNGIKK